jgi:hypothetical protein
MRVVFRVDASNAIGTGHIKRCHTLATSLQKRGVQIHFITRAHLGHMGDMLARDNFAVTLLPQPSGNIKTGANYAAWLGVTQQEDAAHFGFHCKLGLAQLHQASVVFDKFNT